tara:strand:+ start:684 stop:812 length:129 start_codon:yes stop_codon:yes gene_type:complete
MVDQFDLVQSTFSFNDGSLKQVMGAAAGFKAAVDEQAIHERP